MAQKTICGRGSAEQLDLILQGLHTKKFLLVCDASFPYLPIKGYLENSIVPHVNFSDFTPNPLYEDVCKGVHLFRQEGCDAIVAVGGGSALDVAKCVKLFCGMEGNGDKGAFLGQPFKEGPVPLIAAPTTAGTGSEATPFAVIYFQGKKQSITQESILPDCAILDPSVLETLPQYQKICTMLDALCQGIESWWSLNATEESKRYAQRAIRSIVSHMDAYLYQNDEAAAEKVMIAANDAGHAIGITQTTAAHALSYQLTSMYKLLHGHAVAICLPPVWRYMMEHLNLCIAPHSEESLRETFQSISDALGYQRPQDAIAFFEQTLTKLGIGPPEAEYAEDINKLVASVNPTRLRNNPVPLSEAALEAMYQSIVTVRKRG